MCIYIYNSSNRFTEITTMIITYRSIVFQIYHSFGNGKGNRCPLKVRLISRQYLSIIAKCRNPEL